ncbi:hypothetical protein DNTS_013320 [Danionella cerebrum]|uniref:Doublecortin domain-containing protein n=1 Tax=Danionella cerebrum TaxID=2873325 RepID=A0A553QQU9_9TELE|nr:hypothetical protein DNTS_013320 [Danionella translucida]
MSTTPQNEGPHTDVSPGSMHTLASRPLLPHPDPITTKRVCFYKSGDPQFTGHRMVINSRTFKTFDALLDALSKKVPLPFGVRTITTPRGTHAVLSLDDVQDGGSYLCSDQKKVKPFNLEDVPKRQVPWNTTRPVSAGRQARREIVRQLARRNQVFTRTVKMTENSNVVRTPKRLTVFKNRDPNMKKLIVLQRRIAPTFDTLLDYLSQVMQFPVLKLYTEDGRRVEGLSGLILCSGIVVAAGNEPFRLGNYVTQAPKIRSRISEPTETLLQEKKIPSGTNSRSRNFSLSSERFLVEQINKSLNGNLPHGTKTESVESRDSHQGRTDEIDVCGCVEEEEEKICPVMPSEDDIEKSFRVNEDGSMTVEMKVHLTIKQEELVHWTTTLSRTSVTSQQRVVCTSKPESGANSVDVTNDSGKESNGPHSLDSREINTVRNKSVGFIKEEKEHYGSDASSEKTLTICRRVPTPAPRQRRKQASEENIKTVSETEVQESTMGAYSYLERTPQGELKEGYCVVSRSSSSSTRTVTKAGKSESSEAKQKKTQSSFRSSGVAEVLQLQNNGTMGITETVLHIHESQGLYDNYHANTQVDVDSKVGHSIKAYSKNKPGSTDSGPRSSSHDCDVDPARQSTSSNSMDGGKSNMLSLSSACSTPSKKINNNLSTLTDDEKQTLFECTSETVQKKVLNQAAKIKQDSPDKSINVSSNKPSLNKQSKKSPSSGSSGPGKKTKGSSPGFSKDIQMTSDTVSHTGSEKKTSSGENGKPGQKDARDKNNKKMKPLESSPKKKNSNLDDGIQRRSDKDVKPKDKTIKAVFHKVHSNGNESQGAKFKNESAVNPAKAIKRLQKPRSMNGVRSKTTKQRKEMSESVSLPVLQSSSTSLNQYVENWLKKIEPESVPYEDETDPPEIVSRAVFQIGGDSSDCSEIKDEKDSIEEKDPSLENNIDPRLSPPPVQIKCEGELIESQMGKVFCKSMPILRKPSEQESLVRMHKSSENFVPETTSETSQSAELRVSRGMKPVLQQLCLSVQSIKHALSHTNLTSVEKSSSLPDFSSQVASAFGSPSRAVLSFLSMMTLRDGLSVLHKNDSAVDKSAYPEALQVMQSLEKISTIKDEDELRASLTSLHGSTSSKLKQNLKEFHEKNFLGQSPPLSPRFSEQEFTVDVDLEAETGQQEKLPSFIIEELLDELNMPEDLHREISSLVEGDLLYSNQTDIIKEDESPSEITDKDEDSLSSCKNKAAEMEEVKDSFDQGCESTQEDITNNQEEPETSEVQSNQSHSSESDIVEKDIAVPNRSTEGTRGDSNSGTSSVNSQVDQDGGQNSKLYEEIKSEHNSPISEQKATDEAEKNLSEHSFEKQDTVADEEVTNQTIKEPKELSDISEPNEMNTKEAADHSVIESDDLSNCDAAGQDHETKINLSEGESLKSEHFKTASTHDSETKSIESSQEDYGVSTPDIKDIDQQDNDILCSEDEDYDLHYNSKDPQCGTEDEHCTPPEGEHDLLENSIDKLDEASSEACENETYAEPHIYTNSDPDGFDKDMSDTESNKKDSSLCQVPISEKGSLSGKSNKSEDECDADEVDDGGFKDCVPQCIKSTNSKDSVDEGSTSGTITSANQSENAELLGMEHGYHYLLHPTEISQELLDLINSALLSSTLTVTHDLNGNLRIEPDQCKMKEMFMAYQRTNDHYGQKCLPSPNTSDLSDYRPETSENSGYESQEFFTETGGEETERLRIFRDVIKQTSEKSRGTPIKENGSIKSREDTSSQSLKSRSVATNQTPQSPTCDTPSSNKCSLDGNTEQNKGKINSEQGVLIDKGRWLLKENHLIRNSPPASGGLYANGDTTSGDTAQDNRSEDLSYTYPENQASPLAVISSSELEDLVKPPTPKCTYFKMTHRRESDPLLDAPSMTGAISGGDARKKKELKVHPLGHSSNMWAKRNGSMSSFASVEFKLPDGKVHPQEGPSTGPPRSQALDIRTVQDEDSGIAQNFRCGQHCPIL